MTTKAKGEVVWGCWVTWRSGLEACWGSYYANGFLFVPFTKTKGGVLSVLEIYRDDVDVKSAVARKVTLPVPEG